MTKIKMWISVVSIAFVVMTGATALAQYPIPPVGYVEKSLYSQALYAKVQDWVKCSITNYFPDSPIYTQIYIYYQDGTLVWPTDPNTAYEALPWNVVSDKYQVLTEGHYWCEIKVSKSPDLKYVGWGRADYSYEPALLGYEAVHVTPYPTD